MTRVFGLRVASVCLLSLVVAVGCEQPATSEMGSPAEAGGVEFNVVDYELRLLELTDGGDVIEYAEPVLAFEVEVTNQEEGAVTYHPSHESQQMSEASTPLLYKDPGPEAELPPQSKQLIDAVYLQEGELEDQVYETKTLEEGESVTDVFLFEEPDEEQASLILSLPPSMHRGDVPVLFRVNYQRQEPEGPTMHQVGETIERDGVEFSVDEVESKYVEIEHDTEGEGYSSDPFFVVSYTIENTGEETISYEPDHRDLAGMRGAALYADGDTITRPQFPTSATPKEQVEGDTDIEGGDSVSDFALFELPPEETESLTFEFPAKRFDRTGLIRVDIPYEYDEPEQPDELKKAENDG